jgi:hypothetical protein
VLVFVLLLIGFGIKIKTLMMQLKKPLSWTELEI